MRIPWLPKKVPDYKRIKKLLHESVVTNQMTNDGPAVKALEAYIQKVMDIEENKAVIATSSGTTALHALVIALEEIHKSKINWIIPAIAFPSDMQGPLRDAQIQDIGENLEPVLERNNKKQGKRTSGLILTNFFGYLTDISYWEKWAINNNAILLFDNAATAFSTYNKRNVLNYGVGSIVSFHHTKAHGFGEGGAVIVDKKYENNIRAFICFGKGFQPEDSLDHIYFPFHPKGFNGKMSDISAVYIHQHLEGCNELIRKHKILFKKYQENLNSFPTLRERGETIPTCYPIFSKRANEIQVACEQAGIEVKKYYEPLASLPFATRKFNEIICLPLHTDIIEEDIEYIASIVNPYTGT